MAIGSIGQRCECWQDARDPRPSPGRKPRGDAVEQRKLAKEEADRRRSRRRPPPEEEADTSSGTRARSA